jgi:hypothetical protein
VELEDALHQRYDDNSDRLRSQHTVEEPCPPLEKTLTDRVNNYLAFYAPRLGPPENLGSSTST